MNDGKINPLEGLSSPIGMGTLAVTLALTRAVQAIAGKDSKVIDTFLQQALTSELFANCSEEIQTNFKAPIEKALKATAETRELLAKINQS
ncbi:MULTISPECIES: hypothetical protein [Pseudomonas]|uniref:Uncharacterized protein n=1 Tax=Pseudomonas fluorescens TaxID=294 RepID=A0A109KI72_PSEFL|nr:MULTISPECIES: hypothetical protein [Pseudomonas]KWV69682.1 hypothetical protein PFL603g_06387 [Pseudomonas fluorescens]MBW9244192.1 hypothetical protein [Pseudomonas paracarnis]QHA95286.1 hypothetical protein FXO12_00910 [Pseudomonas sp. J380]